MALFWIFLASTFVILFIFVSHSRKQLKKRCQEVERQLHHYREFCEAFVPQAYVDNLLSARAVELDEAGRIEIQAQRKRAGEIAKENLALIENRGHYTKQAFWRAVGLADHVGYQVHESYRGYLPYERKKGSETA